MDPTEAGSVTLRAALALNNQSVPRAGRDAAAAGGANVVLRQFAIACREFRIQAGVLIARRAPSFPVDQIDNRVLFPPNFGPVALMRAAIRRLHRATALTRA